MFSLAPVLGALWLGGCAAASPPTLAAPQDPWRSEAAPQANAELAVRSRTEASSQRRVGAAGGVRALRLTLSVPASDSDEGRAGLDVARALLQAGFQLTDGPGDANIEIRGAAAGDDPETQLALRIVVTHQGTEIESIIGHIARHDRVVAMTDVEDLVRRVSTSATLESFAQYVDHMHASMASARSVQRRPAEALADPAVLEAEAWRPAALRRCRNERTETTCGWIRTYLERFPNGAHAAQARAILGLPVPPSTAAGVVAVK
jgi:hypothetical protein